MERTQTDIVCAASSWRQRHRFCNEINKIGVSSNLFLEVIPKTDGHRWLLSGAVAKVVCCDKVKNTCCTSVRQKQTQQQFVSTQHKNREGLLREPLRCRLNCWHVDSMPCQQRWAASCQQTEAKQSYPISRSGQDFHRFCSSESQRQQPLLSSMRNHSLFPKSKQQRPSYLDGCFSA